MRESEDHKRPARRLSPNLPALPLPRSSTSACARRPVPSSRPPPGRADLSSLPGEGGSQGRNPCPPVRAAWRLHAARPCGWRPRLPVLRRPRSAGSCSPGRRSASYDLFRLSARPDVALEFAAITPANLSLQRPAPGCGRGGRRPCSARDGRARAGGVRRRMDLASQQSCPERVCRLPGTSSRSFSVYLY